MTTQRDLKRTPLYEWHLSHDAKMVPFGGWVMPLAYGSQIDEHLTTRSSASVFDVSHMGELLIRGKDADVFCDWLLPNRVRSLVLGAQASYHPMCREDGTVVDDLLLYYLASDEILLCVNAANTAKDLAFVGGQAKRFGFRGTVADVSSHYAQIAVQGPEARALVNECFPHWDVMSLKRFRFCLPNGDMSLLVSRTGYTGEDGVEITIDLKEAPKVLNALVDDRKPSELRCLPAGLGARDTLRLEAGYALYGHELDDHHSAIESGLGVFCDFEKGEFCGRKALWRHKAHPDTMRHRLIGVRSENRRAPRVGQTVVSLEGKAIGSIVSGAFSPSLGVGIGTAFIDNALPTPNAVSVESGYGLLGLQTANPTFWTRIKKKKT